MATRRQFGGFCLAAGIATLGSHWFGDLFALGGSPPVSGKQVAKPLVSNFREATISVENLEESVDFYTTYFKYKVVKTMEISDDAWRRLWQLPAGTAARVALLRPAGRKIGGFRIVQFLPTSKVFIRMPYRPLDTSFVGCDMPVEDVPGLFKKITGAGWGSVSQAITFVPPQMTKAVTVAAVIGPSGERLPLVSLTELQNDPAYSSEVQFVSAYIGFQITEDIERDTTLYTRLGLTVVRDRTFQMPMLNRAVGLPEDARWRSLQVSDPQETFGRVGLVQYLNYKGRNLSDRSDPPNLGMLMLSFRTRDMAETYARLKDSSAEIRCEPIVVRNALYSETEVMTVKQPNGSWLEFYG